MFTRSALLIVFLALIALMIIDEAVAWRGGGGHRGWGHGGWGHRGWGGGWGRRGWGGGWGRRGWGGYYGGYYPSCNWYYGGCYYY